LFFQTIPSFGVILFIFVLTLVLLPTMVNSWYQNGFKQTVYKRGLKEWHFWIIFVLVCVSFDFWHTTYFGYHYIDIKNLVPIVFPIYTVLIFLARINVSWSFHADHGNYQMFINERIEEEIVHRMRKRGYNIDSLQFDGNKYTTGTDIKNNKFKRIRLASVITVIIFPSLERGDFQEEI